MTQSLFRRDRLDLGPQDSPDERSQQRHEGKRLERANAPTEASDQRGLNRAGDSADDDDADRDRGYVTAAA